MYPWREGRYVATITNRSDERTEVFVCKGGYWFLGDHPKLSGEQLHFYMQPPGGKSPTRGYPLDGLMNGPGSLFTQPYKGHMVLVADGDGAIINNLGTLKDYTYQE